MSPLFGLVVLTAAGMLAAVVAALVAIAGARTAGPSPSEAAAAARRHAGAVTALAWLAAAVAALVAGPLLTRGPGSTLGGVVVGLLPALAGLVHAGVHAVGEVTWPRPTGAVRRAALHRRTVRDVAPRGMVRATGAWLVALATVAVVGTLTAAPDGRSVERTFPGGSAASSPYPGWYYSVPLLVGGVAVVTAAVLVLRLVAVRPAVVDAAPEWDLQMRRLSAHRVLRGTQLVLGSTVAGQLLAAGMALRNVSFVGSAEEITRAPGLEVAASACVLLALVSGLGALVLAALPGTVPTAPRAEAAAPGAHAAQVGASVAPTPAGRHDDGTTGAAQPQEPS